ncbi:duboraya [Melanotaenia boesemani]|uniref:duboraya n=1 Tax=Melanotaenia boesemani TaxID=1250792 RepID=UPI001C03BA62|nr:duboraya [Melanotaenia boesemani]
MFRPHCFQLLMLFKEEAPSRRSVAELAGRFKDSGPPQKNEAEKPVRRRPPRTLQLPKLHGDELEAPPDVTSPQPPKAKRNSALIEKLQANLTLSPTGPPLKSPGLRVLPLAFTPPSPGSAPGTMATMSSSTTPTSPVSTSQLTEGPASFEAHPTAVEGNILTSINKSRARVSIRRRPPSRRHRKSSSGDEVGGDVGRGDVGRGDVGGGDMGSGDVGGGDVGSGDVGRGDVGSVSSDVNPSSPMEAEDKRPGGGGAEEEEGEEVVKKESETESSSLLEKDEAHEEEKSTSSSDVKEGDTSSSHVKEDEEEQTSVDKQKEDSANGGMKDREEDEKNQTSS